MKRTPTQIAAHVPLQQIEKVLDRLRPDRCAIRKAGYVDIYADIAVIWYHHGDEELTWLYLMCSIMKELHA